jgi:hypothetical protein
MKTGRGVIPSNPKVALYMILVTSVHVIDRVKGTTAYVVGMIIEIS